MNGNTDSESIIVYEENFDIPWEVTEQDIIEYGHRLGVDPAGDQVLSAIIRGWILQPLPHYWFPCHEIRSQKWFYFNSLNGHSSWTHPLEDIHQALAKEYCLKRSIKSSIDSEGSERGNPEGQSAEPSMESGSPKLLNTPSPPLELTKISLPRTLAPLKRVSKAKDATIPQKDPSLFSSKPESQNASLLPVQNDEDVLAQRHKNNSVHSASASSSEIISSLNISKVDHVSALPRTLSPLKLPINSIQETRVPAKTTIPKASNQGNTPELVKSSPNTFPTPSAETGVIEVDIPKNRTLIPLSSLSFTERLAAKKASRNKQNEIKSLDTNTAGESSTAFIDKKRVQFSLGNRDVRSYTPECSDDIGIDDESSEDVLELFRNPQELQAFEPKATSEPVFEEKRWEVVLTSFGAGASVTSTPLNSNGKKKCQIEESVSSRPSNSSNGTSAQDNIIPRSMSASNSISLADNLELEKTVSAQSSIPLLNQTNRAESSAPKLPCVTQETNKNFLPDAAEEPSNTNVKEINETGQPTDTEKSKGSIDHVPETCVVDPALSEDKDQLQIPIEPNSLQLNDAPKNELPTEQSNHFGSASLPIDVHSDHGVVIYLRPDCDNQNSLLVHSHSRTTDRVLVSQPNVNEKRKCPDLERTELDNGAEASASGARNGIGSDIIGRTASEDVFLIKKEMEIKLNAEKERLEKWFLAEIEEMKRKFEIELASERQHCSDLLDRERETLGASLDKMLERAKIEKEEAAKREIAKIEEQMDQILKEKQLQVQKHLIDEVKSIDLRTLRYQDAAIQTENVTDSLKTPVADTEEKLRHPIKEKEDVESSLNDQDESVTSISTRSPSPWKSCKNSSHPICQCKTLQKQIAQVEREMIQLKHKKFNVDLRKSHPRKKSSAPVKATRDDWWIDESDESSTTHSSSLTISGIRRFQKSRSRSLTSLEMPKEVSQAAAVTNARRLLSKIQLHKKKAWMDEMPLTDYSSAETPTSSGVTRSTSPLSHFEWENVLHSIHKISGDLRQVWSHIGGGQPQQSRPLSFSHHSKSPLSSTLPWISSENPYRTTVPFRYPLDSTAERTRALRLWLQQNNDKTQFI